MQFIILSEELPILLLHLDKKNILKHKSCLRDVLFVYVFSRFIETNFARFNWLKVAKLSETKNKQSLENFTYLYRDDFIKAIFYSRTK